MAKANVNDKKIMELKDQIRTKKQNLAGLKRFTPITNCSLELDGVKYNLQVLTKEQVTFLLIKLNAYNLSAKDLSINEDIMISGFPLTDWMSDLKDKLVILSRREEEAKLKALESKLHILLSNDKKVELEIGDIESMLK